MCQQTSARRHLAIHILSHNKQGWKSTELCTMSEDNNEQAMVQNSNTEKAWTFVEFVVDQHLCHTSFDGINLVAVDDMFFTCQRMMEMQEQFRALGIPTYVDVGFHYTDASNVDSISTDGLLSRSEREGMDISPHRFHGNAFGDGVYTSDNFHDGQHYGDTCLMVARLKGITRAFPEGRDYNGNNSITVQGRSMTILQWASQCVPIMQFHASLVLPYSKSRNACQNVHSCHKRLQALIDDFFNESRATHVPDLVLDDHLPVQRRSRRIASGLRTTTSIPSPTAVPAVTVTPTAITETPIGECKICGKSYTESTMERLLVCGHAFHLKCIQRVLRENSYCPTCHKSVGMF